MSKNDITNDTLISKPNTKAFEENFDRIFGKKAPQPPHTCLFCGAPSWYDPSDQSPPPDYCHESDHGEPYDE